MWRVERVGWWVMGTLLLAAAVGLLGPGYVSRTSVTFASDSESVPSSTLEYDRLLHVYTNSTLTFTIRGRSSRGGRAVWLSNDYLSTVRVERISPRPASEESWSGGVRYRFDADDEPTLVFFHVKPDRSGPLSWTLRINEGPAAGIRQFVYP